MFAVDVCRLPETGGSTFVVAAGLFMLIAGVIVARWVRQSAGRLSVVTAPLVLLGGFVLVPQVVDPCVASTTTVAPTTVAPATLAPTTTVAAGTTTVAPATTVAAGTTTVAPTTTAPLRAGLVPLFGAVTATADGFTVQVTNYDGDFEWSGSATATVTASGLATASGSVVVSGNGLVTVSEMAPSTSSTVTVTTTRAGYEDGSKEVTGVSLSACAAGVSCALGDTGPGGGIVFYDAGSTQPWGRYLEAALIGTEVNRTWATDNDPSEEGRGNQTTFVNGADGTAIGTGEQNTADIVAQSGNVEATSAAVYCSDLVSGEQSDWFLPSKDELNKIYTNLYNLSTPLGSFSPDFYWTSSESDNPSNAWLQTFSVGAQPNYTKTVEGLVRPVRAF